MWIRTFAQAVPLAGGNMTGALTTPAVNGVQAPAAGSSQTTLQAAMTAAGTNGAMEIPPTYAGTDRFTNPNGVQVTDLRTSGAQQAERSVKEFGAVCDGVTDDTNALQAALNYAQAHGVALTIPQGTCKTRTLNWHGESIGGMGKQVSALMGFPGQDVLASATGQRESAELYADARSDDLCGPERGCFVFAGRGTGAGGKLRSEPADGEQFDFFAGRQRADWDGGNGRGHGRWATARLRCRRRRERAATGCAWRRLRTWRLRRRAWTRWRRSIRARTRRTPAECIWRSGRSGASSGISTFAG